MADLQDVNFTYGDAGDVVTNPFARTRLQWPVLWLTVAAIAAFFIWAANAPLEEVTRGTGKVVPLSGGQIIQSLEGGIITSLAVREGEEVAAGQILVIMDDTLSRTSHEDLEGQTIRLRAALARLRAELAGKDEIIFDEDIEEHERVAGPERELFHARRRKFTQSIESLEQRMTLAQRQLDLVAPMVERGAASAVEEIHLQRTIADLQGELAETRNSYFQEITTEITKNGKELWSLQQQLEQKKHALERTVLRSPVRGIVKNLEITTIGGVVGPGETIMEIVPLDDRLYVEAKIRPQDVAFLAQGLPATVRITAYDYTVYGSLDGELVFISADTIKEETMRDSEPYYRVRVLTEAAHLEGPEGPLPIKPGMVAEVAIETGKKTVLDYLLKPILRGQEALHER